MTTNLPGTPLTALPGAPLTALPGTPLTALPGTPLTSVPGDVLLAPATEGSGGSDTPAPSVPAEPEPTPNQATPHPEPVVKKSWQPVQSIVERHMGGREPEQIVEAPEEGGKPPEQLDSGLVAKSNVPVQKDEPLMTGWNEAATRERSTPEPTQKAPPGGRLGAGARDPLFMQRWSTSPAIDQEQARRRAEDQVVQKMLDVGEVQGERPAARLDALRAQAEVLLSVLLESSAAPSTANARERVFGTPSQGLEPYKNTVDEVLE